MQPPLPLRLGERLAQLLDEGSYEQPRSTEPIDVLVRRLKPHPERIAQAQKRTGARSGALYGTGTIEDLPLVAGIDFGPQGMGGAVGEAITRAAELALERRLPLLVIASAGSMQEGTVSLMQMAKASQAIGRLYEAGLLYVSLLTDPTYGGVSALIATLGDVLIAEPDAHLGFAGPSVIEQTIRQQLPEGFQTAGFLLEQRDARRGRAARKPAPHAAPPARPPRPRRGGARGGRRGEGRATPRG